MQAQRADASDTDVMGGTDYNSQWRALRFRSWVLLLLFVLYLPGIALGVFVLDAISPSLGNRDALWLVDGWGLAFVVAGVYQISFRCPGCGGWFGSSHSWTNPIAPRCLHCGLARYASTSEAT